VADRNNAIGGAKENGELQVALRELIDGQPRPSRDSLLDASSSSPSPNASTGPPDRRSRGFETSPPSLIPGSEEIRTDLAALERVDEDAFRSSRRQPL
jgi:hypothetical protein